jgi:3-methyladenine DNA glycosylase AlkD
MQNKQLTKQLISDLKQHVDTDYRQALKNCYMRNIRKLLGVRVPQYRKIFKPYAQHCKPLNIDEVGDFCESLVDTGIYECRQLAFELSYQHQSKWQRKHFKLFEKWVLHSIEDWSDCDSFCTHTIGAMLIQYPTLVKQLYQWAKHPKWIVNRCAPVALILPIKANLYHDDVFKLADHLQPHPHDLVQKGYGWALKVLADVDRERVFNYVIKHKATMPRVALRYAIEKMPGALRRQAMLMPR